jgi:hypothetical protein
MWGQGDGEQKKHCNRQESDAKTVARRGEDERWGEEEARGAQERQRGRVIQMPTTQVNDFECQQRRGGALTVRAAERWRRVMSPFI